MQKLLLVLNASPYGSERSLSGLRLSLALLNDPTRVQLRVFMLSDAVVTALQGQTVAAGASLGEMLGELLQAGAEVFVCRTCMEARGIKTEQLIPGIAVSTMPALASLTLESDKVIGF
jgi:uncharacterized protein involved in oxidation of intracellular sulfur